MTKQQVIDILEAYKPSGNIYNGYNSIEEKIDERICYLIDGYITIISSEKTGKELIEIDEAVGSRIVEMSGDYFINIGHDTKKNYRLRGIM